MTDSKKPIDVVIVEIDDSPIAELMHRNLTSLGKFPVILVDNPRRFAELFDAVDINLIDLPAARCCVGCRDEIPEGVYHGCNFKVSRR